MEDLRTQAQLVAFDPARAGTGSIGTVISRAEIADAAARNEFPATLLLDLDRVGTAAQARVAVDWDEPTLEKVLGSTEDDAIALWFDEGELARAFDERDVEGHGLRNRAAVLAIAVTAAGASAAPALATMEPGGGGGGGSGAQPAFTANPQAGAQPAGAVRGLQQDENIAVQQTQSGEAAAPAETSSGGGLSSGEIAAIAGAGAVLISAAGFGAARKRTPPVLPA